MIFDVLAIAAIIGSIVWLARAPGLAPVIALVVSFVALIVHVIWDYRQRRNSRPTVILYDANLLPRTEAERKIVEGLLGHKPGGKRD